MFIGTKNISEYRKGKRWIMLEILTQAGCFLAVIFLGVFLRKIGCFGEADFKALSKVVMKITSAAIIITSFAGKEIDPSMLALALIGLGGGLAYIFLAFLLYQHAGREQQAFAMQNSTGYNIGNFTLPFVQGFLGPVGVITASIFDIGNAFICLGGSYGFSSMVKENARFSVRKLLKSLFTSVPFVCYVIVLVCCFGHITLPAPIISFAQILGNANAFLALFIIGVGFRLSGDRSQIRSILKILTLRYGLALIIALGCYFFLPFSLEVRKTLMILAFSPIASYAPALTGMLKGDVGLASAINSVSIICSIVLIVLILVVMA